MNRIYVRVDRLTKKDCAETCEFVGRLLTMLRDKPMVLYEKDIGKPLFAGLKALHNAGIVEYDRRTHRVRLIAKRYWSG